MNEQLNERAANAMADINTGMNINEACKKNGISTGYYYKCKNQGAVVAKRLTFKEGLSLVRDINNILRGLGKEDRISILEGLMHE